MTLSNDELACVYASLILADDNVDIKGEKISTLLKAANYEIEPYWPGLFAGALEGVKVADLLKSVGSAPVAAAPVAAAPEGDKKGAAGKEAAKKEEKKAAKEDSDGGEGDDMVRLPYSHPRSIHARFFVSLSVTGLRLVRLDSVDVSPLPAAAAHVYVQYRCHLTFSCFYHRSLCVTCLWLPKNSHVQEDNC